MGSLGKRMMQQVQERFDFLSGSGPLSVKRQMTSLTLGDADALDALESKDPYPHSPQLACDFFMKFSKELKGGQVVEDFNYSTSFWDSGNWVLSETSVNPAKLSWGYHGQVIGFPVPTVSGDAVRLSFIFPASWAEDPFTSNPEDYLTSLMSLYEEQFSPSTGLLAMPNGDKLVLKVGLEVPDMGLRWDDEYRRVPLFDLVGVKMGTPSFGINPNSVDSLIVSVDMAYSQTRWADLSQTVKKIQHLSLPEVEFRSDQLKNR